MERNRLEHNEQESDRPVRLPRVVAPPLNPANFQFCAVPCDNASVAACQMELYRWAYEQAQATAVPSIVERDLAGVWN